MAAPTLTARTTPTGYQIPDGYRTTIACAAAPAFQIWEQTVKPGGLEAGEPINNTTMFNTRHRTKRAPKLMDYTPITGKGAYDPDILNNNQAEDLIGFETSFTIHYSTGDTRTFWGYYAKLDFDEMKEKELPMVTYEIVETDWDPVENIEAGPVYAAAAGT